MVSYNKTTTFTYNCFQRQHLNYYQLFSEKKKSAILFCLSDTEVLILGARYRTNSGGSREGMKLG